MGQKQNGYKQRSLLFFSINAILLIILAYSLINNFGFGNLPIFSILAAILILVFSYMQYIISQKDTRTEQVELNINNKRVDKTENDSKKDIEDNKEAFSKKLLKGITAKTPKQKLFEKFLSNLINDQQAVIGLYYDYNKKSKSFKIAAKYAYLADEEPPEFKSGEGFNGQVVKDKKAMRIDDLPENYTNIISGLGSGKPKYLIIYPVIINDKVIGVIEMASFNEFTVDLEIELTKFFESNHDKFLNIGDNS